MESWERLGLGRWRMVGLSISTGVALASLTYAVAGSLLGGAGAEVELVLGGVGAYLVASAPKRSIEAAAARQASEAPVLAVEATVNLESTGSRTKALLALSPLEGGMQKALLDAKKEVLLGFSPSEALSGAETAVFSPSAARVLAETASAWRGELSEGGEEWEGQARSAELEEETKAPVLLAACFFAPIMLLLFAVVSHQTSPASLTGLVALQVIVLDLTLRFSSSERSKIR